jgi:hypothetical protein
MMILGFAGVGFMPTAAATRLRFAQRDLQPPIRSCRETALGRSLCLKPAPHSASPAAFVPPRWAPREMGARPFPPWSATTFQTLSKPKATIFKAYGNHFLGPGSIR